MNPADRRAHWEKVYTLKREAEVSWFQHSPEPSLSLIARCGAGPGAAILDVGGGASRLADALLAQGCADVTVLDISQAALDAAQARLGEAAKRAHWIAADILTWEPARAYDLWHDRAAFHFLTEACDRAAYVERLRRALRVGGHVVLATFAPDGPETCSGLPVARHDAASLAAELGASFTLIDAIRHEHATPAGATQRFQYSVFRRTA